MFGNVYAGRRVLVTGHTGFKGSWLTAWLLSLGAKVAGFSNGVPTSPSHFEVVELGGHIRDYRGDVRDRGAIVAALQDFRPEIVFHLAAQALVRTSYEKPADTIEINAMGTLNLLEAVRQTPSVQSVVCITSDKAYRNDEWVWGYRETDHLGGSDPYSASKGCAEIIAHSYFSSFFGGPDTPFCATTRAGNVIGGGDWAADRIVPDCARAWSAGKAVEIRSPFATRPWQHVLEPLSGYLWLAAQLYEAKRLADQRTGDPGQCACRTCCSGDFPLDGEAFNFGPSSDSSHTVQDVVNTLSLYWPGFTSKMDLAGQAGMKECTLLKLCCDKALACLKWHAVLDFPTTMRFTAEWYAKFYEKNGQVRQNMYDVTLDQIGRYCALAHAQNLPWCADFQDTEVAPDV